MDYAVKVDAESWFSLIRHLVPCRLVVAHGAAAVALPADPHDAIVPAGNDVTAAPAVAALEPAEELAERHITRSPTATG